jgi:hypothetical protein
MIQNIAIRAKAPSAIVDDLRLLFLPTIEKLALDFLEGTCSELLLL